MEKGLTNIINIVLENNGRTPIEKVDVEMSLRNDLGFDSMMLAELTVHIEEEFAIDIFEDGIVYTVQEVINKLSR